MIDIEDDVIIPVSEKSAPDSASTKNLAIPLSGIGGRFGKPVISNVKLGSTVASTLTVAFFTPKLPNGPRLSRAYNKVC